MTEGASIVFGAIRFADEPELEPCEIGPLTGLSKGQVSAALRDLQRERLIARRMEGRRRFYRVRGRPAARG